MLEITEGLLRAAKALFGLRGKLANARQARKQQVADFIAAIAQTIEDANAALRQGVYRHGKCQELLSYSQGIVAAIGDLIGQQQAVDLANQLKEV